MPVNPAPVQPVSTNPYNLVPLVSPIGLAYQNGISPIATALGPGPTLALLQSSLSTYLTTTLDYFSATPPPDQTYKLNAMVGSVFNAYIQPERIYRTFYSHAQIALIEQIMNHIDDMLITPAVSASNLFLYIEECIADSNLTVQEQAPLYMAMTIVEYAYPTLYTIATATTVAPWSNLIEVGGLLYLNAMNLRNWLNAAFIGALIGYTESKPLVPTTAADGAGVGENFYTTVAGGLIGTFGAAVFQWTRKPMPSGGEFGNQMGGGCGCGRP